MDLLAIVLAVAFFAPMVLLIEGIERVWAPRTSSASPSPSSSASTSSTRCCAPSAS